MRPRRANVVMANAASRITSKETSNERPGDFRPAGRPHAARHADFHFARPDRSDLPLYDDAGPARIGGAEAVYRYREVRDHGHSLLHPGRQLPDSWRGG